MRPLVLGAAALLLLIAGAYAVYQLTGARFGSQTIGSVAVLPFECVGNDPDSMYLSDGLAESLINSLSQLKTLRVIAYTSVARYKGQAIDPVKVGRDLGVQALLLGKVLRRGEEFSISVALVDARNNGNLWGQPYRRRKADLFTLQEEIAKAVTTNLRLQLNPEDEKRLGKRHTENAEAYSAYLEGKYFWNRRNEDGFKRAVQLFSEATRYDPGYALAYAGLADTYSLQVRYNYATADEGFPKAKDAAQKALKYDDQLAEAYTSLAFIARYYDWDWQEAERNFQLALQYNPGYDTAHHWYALLLVALGRDNDAIEELDRALEIDPLSLIINTNKGWIYYFQRRSKEAIDQFKKTLVKDPTFNLAHLRLGFAYESEHRMSEAIQEFQTAVNLSQRNPEHLAALAHAYGLVGQTEEARKILADLTSGRTQGIAQDYDIAIVYLGLGDRSKAFEFLEKAYAAHGAMMVWLSVDPRWDPIRSDPRFQDLLHRMKFPAS